eukprot:m.134444 g.134444  ORF g.134444 m.134444 type:complete len:119 (+) comp11387_c0_seq1:248-604(+)
MFEPQTSWNGAQFFGTIVSQNPYSCKHLAMWSDMNGLSDEFLTASRTAVDWDSIVLRVLHNASIPLCSTVVCHDFHPFFIVLFFVFLFFVRVVCLGFNCIPYDTASDVEKYTRIRFYL